MERTTLYLPADLQRALRARSRHDGRSQADLIRQALTEFLARQGRPGPRSIGMGEDDQVSGTVSEDYLRQRWAD